MLSGTLVSGTLELGSRLLLGPLEGGAFREVAVTGIQRAQVEVGQLQRGQHATVAVAPAAEDPERPGSSGEQQAVAEGAPAVPEPGAHAGGSGGWGGNQQHDTTAAAAAECAHLMQISPPARPPRPRRQREGHAELPPPPHSRTSAVDISTLLPLPPDAVGVACASARPDLQRGVHSQQEQQQEEEEEEERDGVLSLGASWELGTLFSAGSAPSLHPVGSAGFDAPPPVLGASPPPGSPRARRRPRKGAVLLSPELAPRVCAEFEAVLVLLAGHWPPRGLLSGALCAVAAQLVATSSASMGVPCPGWAGLTSRGSRLPRLSLVPPAMHACRPLPARGRERRA